jgi:two-component system sensor histidine kinase KdpD
MTDDDRPDPDQLLKAIARHDVTGPSGKLSIFFGMSAGVGKTYAMLSAARAMKAGGSDVVIGLVETHGRSETAALAAGLELIPRKVITYRGIMFEEMDLDALLARRPQMAIVDELAHTNVPGARHPKRWQDVVELLEAGIDVYTTVNVQHIESRKAQVEAIGGITVRETVPDAILERASAIELVDITPAELLKRLSEGKVYLGEKAEAAAANFFHEDRLTALRELALRLTAEKVDSDLHDLITTGGGDESWKPAERLMVAVSHSPYSAGLVRATRRIAFGLSAPWIAVYVDTGVVLSKDDRATLAKNLQLVQELGGELVSTGDTDIPGALERIARQRRVTQLVVGRPTRRWRDVFSGGTILDQLARRNAEYDILVLRPEPVSEVTHSSQSGEMVSRFSLRPYGLACGTVAAVALLNGLLLPAIGYKAGGFLFLLSVLGVSPFVTFGAVAVTAVLSALVWDYFFIPPFGTLFIREAADVMMVCSYFVAALVTGTLTHRIQTRQRLIRQREERTEILYDLAKSLVAQSGIKGVMAVLTERLHSLLRGELDLVCTGPEGTLLSRSVLGRQWLQDDKERAVALWAYEHGKSAGWATDTLPSSSVRYLPISGGSGTVLGVLAFRPDSDRRLTQDEENLLSAVVHQLALSLESERLREEAQETNRLRESERLLQTVMDSVSHELRTPLTAISGTASALSVDEVVTDPVRRKQLTEELAAMTTRLNRVVGNLLDMSRLSSGVMSLQKDWHDPLDLVSAALEITRRDTANHEVRLESDDELPLVRVDFHLMAQAVANVIGNAVTYAPTGTCIEIVCQSASGRVKINVCDQGPGIAAGAIPMIFAKFYRGSGARAGGVGLGLAITKAIVEVHGGSVTVANRPSGGACFVIDLPVEIQPEIPPEADAK